MYALVVAYSSWFLQMNADKKTITGTLDISYSSLYDMDVSLTKQ